MLRAIFALGLAFAATVATADTYTCTSVKKQATLGYDGSSKVSVVGKDDVCTFSIGGASVDTRGRHWTYESERRDFELLSRDPSRFFNDRLSDLLREVAEIHGEQGRFLLEAVDHWYDVPQLDCYGGYTDQLGDLRISCRVLDDDGDGSNSQFETSVLFAQVSRPRFVISVEDDTSGREGVYIFLTRVPY